MWIVCGPILQFLEITPINLQVSQGMEQTFKQLSKILTLKQSELQGYKFQYEGYPEQHLQKFLYAYVSKDSINPQPQVMNRFINYMSEQRHCKILPDYLSTLQGAKILSCAQSRSHYFDSESRGYCLYGKAVSALKRKIKQIEGQRSYLASQIENTIYQMVQDGVYPLSKNQSHEPDDVLLHFANDQEILDPIFLSNEVFSPFIPQPYALILILPIPLPKPDHLLSFLRGSLLHIYVEQVNLLNKIMFRELFYKNSCIKGVYFIQEGQVESTGGRIVARGWVTNGKCRSEGYGWKFKVLPFVKSIAKNEHIWKQFTNDLALNKQYPFKLSYLLGLEEDTDLYELPDKKGRRGIKLPRIGHSSFDYGKLTQIEKMKHYDDRINELCDYKEKLFQKKSGNSLNRINNRIVQSYDQRTQRRMLMKQPSNPKPILRYPSSNLTSSSQNILIMSVLKKLQSLTEPKYGSQEEYTRQKKDKLKISPAQLFQKSRIMKKKRYNQ